MKHSTKAIVVDILYVLFMTATITLLVVGLAFIGFGVFG